MHLKFSLSLKSIFIATSLVCWVATPVVSAESSFSDTLTGDWNGTRTRWAETGVEISANFKTDILHNSGGIKSGTQSMLHTDLAMSADFHALYGWSGLTGYLQIIDDRGGRSNANHVGSSLMGVSNLEVNPASTRLFHAWLQQRSEDGRYSALFGLYPVDSEFSTMATAGMFSHPAYGPTAELSLTNLPSIFPISTLGLRLRGQDGTAYAQIAILDGVAGDPEHPKGTHIRFKAGEGAFVIAEIGQQRVAPEGSADGDAPGKLALGLWGYTRKGNDLVSLDGGGNPVKRPRYGGYILGEARLGHLGDHWVRSVDGFIRLSATDGDSSALKGALNIGLKINGLIAGRSQDALGIAYTRGFVGAKYRQSEGSATAYEDALEIGYRTAVNEWLIIQPQIQRIRNAGASPTVKDSTLVGLRIEVAL